MAEQKKTRNVLVATQLDPKVHAAFKEKVSKVKPRTSLAGVLEMLILNYVAPPK